MKEFLFTVVVRKIVTKYCKNIRTPEILTENKKAVDSERIKMLKNETVFCSYI